MALQRGLLVPVQRLRQILRVTAGSVEVFAQLILRLAVARLRQAAALGQRLLEILRAGIEHAAAGCRNQQGVALGMAKQRDDRQQATHQQGAASTVHGDPDISWFGGRRLGQRGGLAFPLWNKRPGHDRGNGGFSCRPLATTCRPVPSVARIPRQAGYSRAGFSPCSARQRRVRRHPG
ncbi:hypothetical protein D3C86_1577470 [compost metagenome]